jgi:hypothetical protein
MEVVINARQIFNHWCHRRRCPHDPHTGRPRKWEALLSRTSEQLLIAALPLPVLYRAVSLAPISGEARADWSRCRHPVARRFGRARSHPQVDAIFLQSDPSARHCNGGGPGQAVICVTGFGAGDSRGRGGFLYNAAFQLLLGRVYDDKEVQERIVRRSKLDWVIVRPVILTDGPKTSAYRALVDPRDWTCGFISRADVADFLVKQIDEDPFLHKTPVLMN